MPSTFQDSQDQPQPVQGRMSPEEQVISDTATSKNDLQSLPAEIRNALYEHIIESPRSPEQYITLQEAFKQQPSLAHTCRKLRDEVRSMYFGNMKLVVSIRMPEISWFKALLKDPGEGLVSALRHLSFEMPCCGHPELGCNARMMPPHSVMFDIKSGQQVVERHGVWHRRDGGWCFEAMRQTDSFGLQTCNMFGAVAVEYRGTKRFQKSEIIRIVDALCEHPLVAPRLRKS